MSAQPTELPFPNYPFSWVKSQNWPYIRLRLTNLLLKGLRRKSVCAHELTFRKHFAHPSGSTDISHVRMILEIKAGELKLAVRAYRMRKEGYEASARCEATREYLDRDVCELEIRQALNKAREVREELREAHASARYFYKNLPEDMLDPKLIVPALVRKRLAADLFQVENSPYQ